MGIGPMGDLAGEWELAVDLPGAEDVRGSVLFEVLGEVLVVVVREDRREDRSVDAISSKTACLNS